MTQKESVNSEKAASVRAGCGSPGSDDTTPEPASLGVEGPRPVDLNQAPYLAYE